MLFPDYKKGLVNLVSSIIKYYGIKTEHDTLPEMDSLLQKEYKNVVLMLFDGMGVDTLYHHLPEESFLRRHFRHPLSSVFPPTTTAAVTSIHSGLMPAEHGWLGWSLYFSEVDKVVNAFINTVKGSGEPAADYHVAERFLPYKTVYEKINEGGAAQAFQVSKFGTNKVSSLEEMLTEVRRLCQEEGRKYICSYWEEPDSLMHENGCYDSRVTEYLERIDGEVEALCKELSDTLIIITADHGHINTRYECVSEHPELEKMLYRPVSVECRAAAFYVKEEYNSEFRGAFWKAFGDGFLLLSREEVIERKLFGEGMEHLKFREFIGDYLAVSISDKGIVQTPRSQQLLSNHAGMTEKEMQVPFIVVSKNKTPNYRSSP